MNKFKFTNKKCGLARRQAGMTYVELIVVLSIFSVMSSIVLFNYQKFQAKVDIKVLANDIALKIVEAQKSATSGKGGGILFISPQVPAYGVDFNPFADTKSFIDFADLNNNNLYDDPFAPCPSGECLDKIFMNKNYAIYGLTIVGNGSCPAINTLDIVFKRPDSSAHFNTDADLTSCAVSYADIDIYLVGSTTHSHIAVYPSGRIQIN